MLIVVQQKFDQSLTQGMGLRGKKREATRLCRCLGDGVITDNLRLGDGPLSGSFTTFSSLQGSLWAEAIVLSCVALKGRGSTKGDREANRRISCPGRQQGPRCRTYAKRREGWRGCQRQVLEGQAWVTSFSSLFA